MNHECLRCTSCGGRLTRFGQDLICDACSHRYPVIAEIPLFGEQSEIEKWTRYHTNPDNARRVASGGYISEQPSPNNAYYSRFIPDGATLVLDVGGGDGNCTSDWAERHPEAQVYVMDLSLHGLQKVLRRNLPNMIPICVMADRRFPFPNAYFDVIITVFMIEHLSPVALKRFYREAKRVLKPGGRFIVASDTRFYDSVIHPLERLVRNGKYIKNDPTHINLMTPKEAESGLAQEGFRLVARTIHWVAGRHTIARTLYGLLPDKFAEAAFSTMYIITAKKESDT